VCGSIKFQHLTFDSIKNKSHHLLHIRCCGIICQAILVRVCSSFSHFSMQIFSCVASSIAYTQRVLTIIFLYGQAINCKSESQIHTHMNFWCVVFVIEKSNRTRKNGKAKKEKPNWKMLFKRRFWSSSDLVPLPSRGCSYLDSLHFCSIMPTNFPNDAS